MSQKLEVTKEQLARFAECTVEELNAALCAGIEFKTLADAQNFFEDVKKAKKFKEGKKC